tara:strand:- start:210 stop:740 length:531 start_codon:yes stop_codon:yes gene_type:complete
MGQRLTDKSALNNHTGTGDLYMIVDVSDTTGSAAGTSKKLDSKFVIQTDKISLSSADIQGLDSTAKTLVSAPGSGYAVIPISAMLMCTYAAPEQTNRSYMLIGHESGGTFASLELHPMKNKTNDNTYKFTTMNSNAVPTKQGSIDNLPLILHTDSTAFDGGFTADLYITYQIVLLS